MLFSHLNVAENHHVNITDICHINFDLVPTVVDFSSGSIYDLAREEVGMHLLKKAFDSLLVK